MTLLIAAMLTGLMLAWAARQARRNLSESRDALGAEERPTPPKLQFDDPNTQAWWYND